MDILRRFQGDYATKDAFRLFIYETINEEALKLMYMKEDVSHISDAKALIDRAFERLDATYTIKEESHAPTNQAK